MALTSRERVTAAFEHREPDRTPIFEYVLLSPMADRFLGHRCAFDPDIWFDLEREVGWERAARQWAMDHLDLAEHLGHDLMYVLPVPIPEAPRPCHVSGTPLLDGRAAERVHERNARAREEDPTPPDVRFIVYHLLREEMERRGLDLPIFAPAYEHGIWTDVDLMQTMLCDPEAVEEHFSLATRRARAWIDKYLENGIDMIGIGGDFSGNRPMISPASYRTFIVPEVQTLARHIHAHGARAVNASDGNLWPVIDDFLFGCEVDGYVEIDLFAGMTMRELKAKCAGRVTLLGNLDCGHTLSFGTPEDVFRHTQECLRDGLGGGGHILTASNAITASVPVVNYLQVIQAHRDFFGLPPLALNG